MAAASLTEVVSKLEYSGVGKSSVLEFGTGFRGVVEVGSRDNPLEEAAWARCATALACRGLQRHMVRPGYTCGSRRTMNTTEGKRENPWPLDLNVTFSFKVDQRIDSPI